MAATAAPVAPPTPGLIQMIREIEASMSTGETIAAGDRVREALNKSSDAMYAAADAMYIKIKKTGRWPIVLRGFDKEWAARKQRKLYYEAAAALREATRAIRAVVTQQEEILAANNAKAGTDYDATK